MLLLLVMCFKRTIKIFIIYYIFFTDMDFALRIIILVRYSEISVSLETFSLRKRATVRCEMLRAAFPTFNDFFIVALKAP